MTTLAVLVKLLEAVVSLFEKKVGEHALRSQWLCYRVANDEYIHHENQHFRRLRSKLPCGIHSDEDLKAEIRRFAVEAAYRFDPSFGASFGTFLWKHVQTRCIQFHTSAWLKKNYPQNGESGALWLKNMTSWGTEKRADESEDVFEHLDGHNQARVANPDYSLDLKDILSNLTPESKAIFDKVAEDMGLVMLAAKPTQHKKLSERIGVSKEKVQRMMEEVRHVAKDYA